jgi:hypothetical protein
LKDGKKAIEDGLLTQKMAEVMCDCYAEKAAVKYKSEAEASHDIMEQHYIGQDCAEALKDTLIKLKNNN